MRLSILATAAALLLAGTAHAQTVSGSQAGSNSSSDSAALAQGGAGGTASAGASVSGVQGGRSNSNSNLNSDIDASTRSAATTGPQQNAQQTAFNSIYREAASPAIAGTSTFAPGQACGASVGLGVGGLSHPVSIGIPLPATGCGQLKELGATAEVAERASNPKFWMDLALQHYWTVDPKRRKAYEAAVRRANVH